MSTIKKNFLALIDAYRNDRPVLNMIERSMNALLHYVEAVFTMETQIAVNRFRLSGEEFRDLVTDLDTDRRRAHDAAVSYTAALCRMAAKEHVAPMFDGVFDQEQPGFDREAIAAFCMEAVKALFLDRSRAAKLEDLIEAANQ